MFLVYSVLMDLVFMFVNGVKQMTGISVVKMQYYLWKRQGDRGIRTRTIEDRRQVLDFRSAKPRNNKWPHDIVLFRLQSCYVASFRISLMQLGCALSPWQ